MHQMLRQPAPGALTFIIYRETHTATMTGGSQCYILLLRTMLYFDACRAWTVLVQTLKKYFEGSLNPPHPPHRSSQDFQLGGLKFKKFYPIAGTDPENFGGEMQI